MSPDSPSSPQEGPVKPKRRALWICFLTAASLLSVGYLARETVQGALAEDAQQRLVGKLATSSAAIEHWLASHSAIVESWAAVPEVVQMIERQLVLVDLSEVDPGVLLGSVPSTSLRQRLGLPLASHAYAGFLVIDRRGTIVAASHDEPVGRKVPTEFLGALAAAHGGRSLVTPISRSEILLPDAQETLPVGPPTMLALAPIRNRAGEVVAVLGLRLRPDEGLTQLLEGGRRGGSGQIYAVDREGRMLSHSRFEPGLDRSGPSAQDPGANSAIEIPVGDPGVDLTRGRDPTPQPHERPLTRAAASVVRGETDSDLLGYRDYRGVRVVGAWTWIDSLGLGLISEEDFDEAFSALIPIERSFVAILGLLTLCAVGLLWTRRDSRRWRERSSDSERHARLIVEAAMDAIVGMDETGTIADWNSEAERLFGWSRAEAMGQKIQELIIPEELRAAHLSGMARHLATGDGRLFGRRVELPALHKDGYRITVELAVNPPSITPKGRHYSAFLRDVSGRKRAEAYVRWQSAALELLASQASIEDVLSAVVSALEARCPGILGSILILDEPGRRLLHGAGPSLPAEYNRAVHGLPIGPEAGSCGSAAFLGERVIVEDIATDVRWATGRELALSHGLRACWSQPILATNRRTLGTFAMYYREARRPAPTELAALEEATHLASLAIERRQIEAEQERLRCAVDAAADGIVLTDATGKILRVNRAFSRICGFSAEDVVGCTPRILSSGEHPPEFYREMWATITDGRIWSGRIVNRCKDASLAHVSLTIAPIVDAVGVITGYVGVHRDVEADIARERELREAVTALAQAREAAEVANRSKSEFLANMSHEIRTPMTAILGFTELLLDEDDLRQLPQQRVETLRTIQTNGQHLLELINDILDLSKIEAGRMTVESLACSPRRILADVESLMRVRSQAKGLELRFEQEGPLPATFRSDPTRLRQILVNLVGNAIKFTERGIVRVRSRVNSSATPTFEVDVIDTGIGMTAEQQDALFQPFVQADGSTARRFGGTGLGLVISRRLAELLGGRVEIMESCLEKGTTFRLSLALGTPEEIPELGASEPDPPAALPAAQSNDRHVDTTLPAGTRILLAEDSRDNQRLVSLHLRRAGAEVEIAENGRIAVDRALESLSPGASRFDAILMDMQMPELDGYAATRLLRVQGYRGPIIALTANAMEGDRDKCLAAGCTDYATKPIDKRALFSTLRRHVVGPAGGGARLEGGAPAQSDVPRRSDPLGA